VTHEASRSRRFKLRPSRLRSAVRASEPVTKTVGTHSPALSTSASAAPLRRRQLCWSHLQRDFQAHAEGLAAEKEFGEVGLELCERVFWAWEVFAHTRERRELKRTIRQLQRQYKPIIRGYASKRARNKRCRGMARNLYKAWPALWSFANHKGVEPTNNHAERALRGAVIYRKLSLGSQSAGGERRIERLLSAHTTCRLQRRSLFAYLTELLAAHARGDPVPLLA
jgi:transposase